ncbi:MAG TPA: wax ester/triacylglycerol synthase domain-containing protein, partial [Solirubrobacteraceae bacterium]|nr:wax ester/triacylglycerol synthase domain-containing protein [Solirubrobacteraceae bacterium]
MAEASVASDVSAELTGFADREVHWGRSSRMNDLEAMMWRAEADPMLRSHGLVLNLLERAPDWDRLVDAHEWGVRRVPRLAARVVDDPARLGPPEWVPAEVDLAYHLRRAVLPAGADEEDVLAVADAMMMAPFDPARPLWEAMLVEGLPGGRAAYLIKLHHALADGKGFVQLFDLLFSDRAETTADKYLPAADVAEGLDPVELSVRHALAGLQQAPGLLRRVARA